MIIPPRYAASGKLPIQLYGEKLFRHLNQNYYLGFYTAAKIHGASHQQVQRDYVLTTTPKLNNISKGTLDIRFFTTSHWPDNNILTKKKISYDINYILLVLFLLIYDGEFLILIPFAFNSLYFSLNLVLALSFFMI